MLAYVCFSLDVHFRYVHVNKTNILRYVDPSYISKYFCFQQGENNEYHEKRFEF